MPHEEWRVIEGFDSMYEVSSLARVRSWKNARHGRSKKPHFLKPGRNGHGYRQVNLHIHGRSVTFKVAVLVAVAFIGPKPQGFDVNHKDGNKENDLPSNLEWCSRSDNILHAYRTGLAQPKVGEICGASKLTQDDVATIRRLYATGRFSTRVLGKRFGVSNQHISRIVRGQQWKHV